MCDFLGCCENNVCQKRQEADTHTIKFKHCRSSSILFSYLFRSSWRSLLFLCHLSRVFIPSAIIVCKPYTYLTFLFSLFYLCLYVTISPRLLFVLFSECFIINDPERSVWTKEGIDFLELLLLCQEVHNASRSSARSGGARRILGSSSRHTLSCVSHRRMKSIILNFSPFYVKRHVYVENNVLSMPLNEYVPHSLIQRKRAGSLNVFNLNFLHSSSCWNWEFNNSKLFFLLADDGKETEGNCNADVILKL